MAVSVKRSVQMELFVLLSFIGTVVLLSTHVLDYASECLRRPAAARRAMPDTEVPSGDEPAPWQIAGQYDCAA